jgi:hypothetical protein
VRGNGASPVGQKNVSGALMHNGNKEDVLGRKCRASRQVWPRVLRRLCEEGER